MTDVSRETPSTPELARRAFPSGRLPLAERYVELLATVSVGIAGNTICPLGEAAAWPMLGFLTKFRADFEAKIPATVPATSPLTKTPSEAA